ncbi:MAG: hypothetical protein CVV11_13880 [Gammaproteobacteria bacterium HGW-Gammaproteobacteria-15]|nr:MAG: hypothetical protein CVV11_13880 [Gammaproteobacteria bacterium HGW-Gammaproteobacteria-15]
MFKNYLFALFSVTTWVTSFNSNAGDELRICYTCNSFNDYSNAVLQGVTKPTNKVISVYNPTTGTILNFNAVVEIEPGAPVIKYVISANVTTHEYQAAAKATDSYVQLMSFFDTNKEIPSSLAGSIFDVIGNSQKQELLSDYYNLNITSGQTWALYWASIGSLGGSLANIAFSVDVIFSDGSRATMRLSGLNSPITSRLFYLTLVETFDKNGNRVPHTGGEFDYRRNDQFFAPNAESMFQLLEIADRYNVPSLVFTTNSYKGGGRVSYVECKAAEKCLMYK